MEKTMKARILLTLTGILAGCISAFGYDYNGTPVGSWIVTHSTTQIKQAIVDGWRPTSIETESVVGPMGFYRVNYVRNSGSHFMDVRFEGEKTGAQVDAIRNSGWRIEDVAVAGTSNGTRLAGIYIRNNVSPRTTLFFWGWTSTAIGNWLNANPTYRMLDLDRYTNSDGTRYAGVFIRNTGAAFVSGWGWSPAMSWDQVGSWASQNGMRVIDLDRHPSGNYAVVFAKRLANQRYFYFGNRTMTELLDFLGNRGLRAQTISETTVNGTARYSGTAINNVGAQAARLADLVPNSHNGIQGYYVKEIGGSTIVDIHGTRSMHPSSTIKVLLHFTGVYQTATNQLGTRKLSNIPLQQVHSLMMWNSNNTMANLCLDSYGEVYAETVGRTICGMSTTTNFRNRFGTGGPYGNDSITTTTLADLGKLYTTVENGYFNTTKNTWFRNNMLNNTNAGGFNSTINSVRSQLGISTTKYNDWVNRIRYLYKAGNNSDDNGVNGYWSIAGSISLPFKNGNLVTTKKYVYGHYVNKSTINYSGWTATAETIREQIKASMTTFK